jgi:serine protease Do
MNRLLHMCLLLALVLPFAPAHATETQDIFKHFEDRIVQIRILETSSGSRVALGSGFCVSAAGEIVTNYHVIADLVHEPEKYRAEIVSFDGRTSPLTLLNFDAVNDLAVVAGNAPSSFFELYTPPLQKGMRLYSMGVPLDLGFTIVEGTYNGLLADSQYEKIHFTGSINPGMSGGPAILDDGRVVGVNVSTAGNQVSFLVPAKFVIALMKHARSEGAKPLLERLAEQLRENQKNFMAQLTARSMNTVTLGPYLLPGKIAPYVKCWGDNDRNQDNLFEHLSHACSSGDDLYVSGFHRIRFLRISHDYLSSRELGTRQFNKLYAHYFSVNDGRFRAGKEDVTKFTCQTGFVEHAGLTMRTVICMRAYKKLPGLYDAVLKVAILNNESRGAISAVELGGVSYDNAILFSKKYLEGISWKKK